MSMLPVSRPDFEASAPSTAVSAAVVEGRLLQHQLERGGRISQLMGLVYLPVAASHFALLPPEGQWPMFGLAVLAAGVLLVVHGWVERHPERVEGLWLSTGCLYACVIVHSLARLVYARGLADSVFVGVLAVGLALLPAR